MSTEKEAKAQYNFNLTNLDKRKGVMKMGDKAIVEVETISSVFRIDLALGLVDIQEEELLKYTVQNHLENYFDTSCYCRSSKAVELQLLLMLNMHSIEIMLKN
jgi:hypothetical protein